MSKLSKEELRAPDQIWRASASTYDWAKNHWIWLSLGIGLALVLAIGILFSAELKRQKESEAQGVLGEILRLYEQLEVAGAGATELETSRAEMDVLFATLQSQHANTRAALFAHLVMGRLAFGEARFEEAQEFFESFHSGLGRDSAMADYPLAKAHEEAGNWEAALSLYESLASRDSGIYLFWAQMGRARALRHLGRYAEAVALYEELIRDNPRSTELGLLRGLRAFTESQIRTESP